MPSNLLEEKIPPQAIDAEMAVLGSMLMESDAVERALEEQEIDCDVMDDE